MKTAITSRQQRRLQAGIRNEIQHYQQCLQLIDMVDAEVFAAGMTFFTTEAALALWLCEPALLLGSDVPLKVLRTDKGRQRVVMALTQIAHGLY